ncbi:hypothetical protein SNEBB_009575 [Seison nebaliae]|nr:hypothetical protein SNEBB_009575 [Seison nebaliae]
MSNNSKTVSSDANNEVKKQLINFDEQLPFTDVQLVVEGKQLHCHRSILSLWSPVFQRMFEADFLEKSSNVVTISEKRFSDVSELLQVIYPPNKEISDENVTLLLQLSDEYQMSELTKRCRQFLMTQRGSINNLLIGQNYNFPDVIRRCCEHMKHSINTSTLLTHQRYNELDNGTKNSFLLARSRHLEAVLESIRRKLRIACEKFRLIRQLPGIGSEMTDEDFDATDTSTLHCTQHTSCQDICQECQRLVRQRINFIAEKGGDAIE